MPHVAGMDEPRHVLQIFLGSAIAWRTATRSAKNNIGRKWVEAVGSRRHHLDDNSPRQKKMERPIENEHRSTRGLTSKD